jgi:spore germination cell wall hydrolase CwlJ-like protein
MRLISLAATMLVTVSTFTFDAGTDFKPPEKPPAPVTAEIVEEETEYLTCLEVPTEVKSEPVTVPLTITYAAPEPVEEPIPEPTVRYELTDAERWLVESVVMAESGGESYEGQMAVAQCFRNGCEDLNLRPAELVIANGYTPWRPEPSQSVKDAVSAVFDRGEVAVDDDILWFYAPAMVYSSWHESQRYVCTIGGHKFFAKWG